MAKEKLKPCPFCGREPKYITEDASQMVTIYCRACPCEMSMFYGSRADKGEGPIVERWNTRVGT